MVGAHWDTTGFTDGYNDNGSGLATMLEVARALVESECRLMYTVIFVAFDKEEVDVISVKMKSIVPSLYLNFRSGVKAVMSSFVDF